MECKLPQKILKSETIGSNGLKKSGIPTPTSNSMKRAISRTASEREVLKSTPSSTIANNENMPPPKSVLTRSATTATITKKNIATPRVAPKRPATSTSSAIQNKKPRVGLNKLISNIKQVEKSTEQSDDLGKLINRPKPNKWDLKGRLAYASDELVILKKRYSDVLEEYEKVNKILNDLRENDQDHQQKAEKLEIERDALLKENEDLVKKIKNLTEETVILSEKLKSLEEKSKETSTNLKEIQMKYEVKENELLKKTKEVIKLDEIVKTQEKTINEVNTNRDALLAMLHKLDQERRALHNTIQDLKGKIRVFCRVRPRTEKEQDRKMCTLNFVDETSLEVARAEDTQESCGKLRTTRQEFTFDKVFPPSASQEQIFEELELLVQSALEGYNVCVFAYGQTGSGKTYTMEGGKNEETEGMIPRTVRHIFKEMKNFELLGWEYTVEASILEIYNEHIVDLLDSEPKTHEIRMVDSKKSDLYVTNLHVEPIDSPEKLHECLLIAHKNRAVAATSANERSSRSHSVTRIRLIGKHTAKNEICIGNLNLVDLAGSERLKNEEASRTVETKSINKSLSNLGNVILALLKKQDHIPYRNSKLTHILMPSLGGNSKTLMLLNISPLDDCFNETLNSLRFASTVNSCRMGNVKRQKTVLQNSM